MINHTVHDTFISRARTKQSLQAIKGINREYLLSCSSLEAGKQRQIPGLVMYDLSVFCFVQLNRSKGAAEVSFVGTI